MMHQFYIGWFNVTRYSGHIKESKLCVCRVRHTHRGKIPNLNILSTGLVLTVQTDLKGLFTPLRASEQQVTVNTDKASQRTPGMILRPGTAPDE